MAANERIANTQPIDFDRDAGPIESDDGKFPLEATRHEAEQRRHESLAA